MSVLKGLKFRDDGPSPSRNSGPVWAGPAGEGPNGGITFSLLSRFLSCRERFRIMVVEGLKPAPYFNHRLEYGNLWHYCSEHLSKADPTRPRDPHPWLIPLTEYAKGMARRYPLDQEQVDHWYNVCKVQFPVYVDYWRNHKDVQERKPLFQEKVFNVKYELPSGRFVRLRGKFDAVDIIGCGKGAGIYLQENKTKADINEQQLVRQLTFDLQTMMYLVALKEGRLGYGKHGDMEFGGAYPVLGVRYDVVRRPLGGGAPGNIRRKKPTKALPDGESKEAFYRRLGGIIKDSADHYFMRWKVEVTPDDVERFCRQCLNPILENLLDWWDEVNPPAKQPRPLNYSTPHNWRHPFGVYNPLDEGGSTDLDEYLTTGSEVGLARQENLFPELTEV